MFILKFRCFNHILRHVVNSCLLFSPLSFLTRWTYQLPYASSFYLLVFPFFRLHLSLILHISYQIFPFKWLFNFFPLGLFLSPFLLLPLPLFLLKFLEHLLVSLFFLLFHFLSDLLLLSLYELRNKVPILVQKERDLVIRIHLYLLVHVQLVIYKKVKPSLQLLLVHLWLLSHESLVQEIDNDGPPMEPTVLLKLVLGLWLKFG